MALPALLIPILAGAAIGAATNPDDKLRGAIGGGLLGAFTGGMGGALAGGGGAASSGIGASLAGGAGATSPAAAGIVSSGLGTAGTAAALPGAASSGVGANLAANLAMGANPGSVAASSSALSGGASSGLAQSLAGGVAPQSATVLPAGSSFASPTLASQVKTGLGQMASGATENPMKTQAMMQLTGMGVQPQQQAPMIQSAPITQPQVARPPSVSERIGDEPTFIPKPLFSSEGFSEEEKMRKQLLQRELQARGLA